MLCVLACFHPLKGFPIGLTASGKTEYKITSYSADHVEVCANGISVAYDEIRSPYALRVISDYILIPCGQCIDCRLQYSRDWANRCMLELEYHDAAWFITLTYDDDNVPRHDYADPETGELFQSLSLEKRDLQLFFKRLRKSFPNDKIRYFCAGEYGSETFRPHYHCIIYGLHLDDLQFYKKNFEGSPYWNSEKLSKIWGKGHVVIAEVNWETCAYTARYIMKKLKGQEAVFYDMHNLQPEFTVMSRKPGIARQWYDDHPDLYDYDFIHLKTEKGGLKFKPPRYYDKLYDVEYPDEMHEIKEIRKRIADDMTKLQLEKTSLSYIEMLEVVERNREAQLKQLIRDKI